MITSAAVKIKDLRQDKEIVIPCHRHCHAFEILHEFGYKAHKDFEEIEQGFLDENNDFFSRTEAFDMAIKCNQISFNQPGLITGVLFSEDVW